MSSVDEGFSLIIPNELHKLEIRISNSETNPKFEFFNLVILICFGFRYSSFGFTLFDDLIPETHPRLGEGFLGFSHRL